MAVSKKTRDRSGGRHQGGGGTARVTLAAIDVRKGAGNFLRGATPSQDMMAVVYVSAAERVGVDWLF